MLRVVIAICVATSAGCFLLWAMSHVQPMVRDYHLGPGRWIELNLSPGALHVYLLAADMEEADFIADVNRIRDYRLRIRLSSGRRVRPIDLPTWAVAMNDSSHGVRLFMVGAILLLGPLLLVALRQVQKDRRGYTGDCLRCGYDLRACQSTHCPECGAALVEEVDEPQSDESFEAAVASVEDVETDAAESDGVDAGRPGTFDVPECAGDQPDSPKR